MMRKVYPTVQDVPEPHFARQHPQARCEYRGVKDPSPASFGKLVQFGRAAEDFPVPYPHLDVSLCHIELLGVFFHSLSIPMLSVSFELQF